MSENSNLITVVEPKSYVYRRGHSHAARLRSYRGRSYYFVIRRCREDEGHRPEPVRVFADTLTKNGGLKGVFDHISTHCLECGAES